MLNTTEIKAEEKEGRLNYTFGDGQNWEFVIDPEGAFNYPTVRAGNGLVQRVGEQRKIINHSATMQINRNVLCSETP